MITFPHAKINLGLFVTRRLENGYHVLQTLFYPIKWRDALEIIPLEDGTTGICKLKLTGIAIDGDPESNLCVKAYRRLQARFPEIPSVQIHLKKIVPFGAGLGGGSSDGAHVLLMLREMFDLPVSNDELEKDAAAMGADCAFFCRKGAQYCEGIGSELEPYDLSLDGKFIVIVKPPFGVSTKEAYSNVKPVMPVVPLYDLLKKPVELWKDCVFNDFEKSVFPLHPELADVKESLYKHGAVYASMSGSGSAMFGIFDQKPSDIDSWFPEGYEVFC